MEGCEFTGRVPDVAPYMCGADAFVIPLHVGGGTRIKAFEAMAAGVPVVSTAIGVEGLGLQEEREYCLANESSAFAEAIVSLLRDRDLGLRLSQAARRYVELNASHRAAAQRFEDICVATLARASAPGGGGERPSQPASARRSA